MSKALVESTVSIAEEEKETSNDCGIWNGIKFKSKPVLETVVKFILICNKNYNDFPTIELLNLVFDTNHFDDDEEPIIEFQKELKKHYKTQKKKNQKLERELEFVPENMEKPARSAYLLYMRKLKEENIKKEIKMTKEQMIEKYNCLNVKAKNKLQKEYDELKNAYKVEVDKLRQQAIENGEISRPKPRQPATPSIHFRSQAIKQISGIFVFSEEDDKLTGKERQSKRKQIVREKETKIAEIISKISEKEKKKIQELYQENYKKYREEMEEWKKEEEKRLCKISGREYTSDDEIEVNISSSRQKKKSPILSKIKNKTDTEEDINDANVEENNIKHQAEESDSSSSEEEEIRPSSREKLSKKTNNKEKKKNQGKTKGKNKSEPVEVTDSSSSDSDSD